MKRVAGIVILGLLPTVALGSDDAPVKGPYVEPGDCWSYRVEGTEYRGAALEYEECVTLVNRSRNSILALATMKWSAKEIETSYSLDWDIRVGISRVISPEGVKLYKFPLRVGDTYPNEYRFWDALRGPNAGKVKMQFKVVGWESIVVPAGTFRAIKVVGEGTVQRSDRIYSFNQKQTLWYVPDVNRHVKMHYENPDRWVGEELTGYRLNK